jgi:hypothetical protein
MTVPGIIAYDCLFGSCGTSLQEWHGIIQESQEALAVGGGSARSPPESCHFQTANMSGRRGTEASPWILGECMRSLLEAHNGALLLLTTCQAYLLSDRWLQWILLQLGNLPEFPLLWVRRLISGLPSSLTPPSILMPLPLVPPMVAASVQCKICVLVPSSRTN